jgi:putative oxidoreductase
MSRWLTLAPLAKGSDAALLALRLLTGAFLIAGVWDNVVDPARMAEFETFQRRFGIPLPGIGAPLSVYAQLVCGVAFIVGGLTRWAGLVMLFNFAVAWIYVDRLGDFRAQFPCLALLAIAAVFATLGPGRWALDSLIGPRAPWIR